MNSKEFSKVLKPYIPNEKESIIDDHVCSSGNLAISTKKVLV